LRFALTGSRSDGFPTAGLGRAPSAAAEDLGNASRGNLLDSDEIADAADRGLPTLAERIA
jgi:hypothetical protein